MLIRDSIDATSNVPNFWAIGISPQQRIGVLLDVTQWHIVVLLLRLLCFSSVRMATEHVRSGKTTPCFPGPGVGKRRRQRHYCGRFRGLNLIGGRLVRLERCCWSGSCVRVRVGSWFNRVRDRLVAASSLMDYLNAPELRPGAMPVA